MTKPFLETAMGEGLDISKVESPLFANKEFVKRRLCHSFGNKAKKLWEKVPSCFRQDPSMWYMTLENQIIIFEELPEHLKTKESVLMRQRMTART